MAERSIIDQLDDAITALLAKREPAVNEAQPELAELVAVARELHGLPSEEFRAALREQLGGKHNVSTAAKQIEATPQPSQTITPYLTYRDAAAAIDFYKRAFGATELMRLAEPSGKIGHAELKIGEGVFMIADEYPDYGAISAETLGGSPIKLHLYVSDVDQFAERALAEGASLSRPVADQFYGDRSGQIKDPFGYTWVVATHQKDVPVADLQKGFDEFVAAHEGKTSSKKFKREGLYSVNPYLTVKPAVELIDFVKQAFGAVEAFRTTGSAGGLHCEVRIGDSVVMIGGGPTFDARPAAIHLYVSDVDDVYERAMAAGATSLGAPSDQEYGERIAAVKDIGGNEWYIAKRFAETPVPDLHNVTLYFHPVGAPKFIDFLQQAFGAEVVERHQSDEGFVYHAKVRIGDAIVEMGEAHDQWQPMQSAIYMFVEDVDAAYRQALNAGATSALEPTDQPYGERSAWVNDEFGNIWYLSTLLG
ncbi:MAG TPA: VOC family protein [Pyrinomonadaceae bacterium]|nr:VOC family protein [Pyrinomonadaceae bacterium]